MGERTREILKLQFDKRLRLEFHGARNTPMQGCWPVGNWMGCSEREIDNQAPGTYYY